MFSITIKNKTSFTTFFLKTLQKYYQLPNTNDNTNLKKFWCLSACKKWTPSLPPFLRYCKDISNLLLLVLWECLILPINSVNVTLQEMIMPRILKSTYRKLLCLYECKISTSSLTSFMRYCKDIANLLFWEIWQCLTIPIKNHSINL